MPARRSRASAENLEAQTAQCFRCGEWKPFSGFSLIRRNAGKNKRQTCSTCKKCRAESAASYTVKKRVEFSAAELEAGCKKCSLCLLVKPLSQMVKYNGDNYKSSYMPRCLDCHRERARLNYAKRMARSVDYHKKYYSVPIKRAAMMHNSIKARSKLCGIEFTLPKSWFLDRIQMPCQVTGLNFSFDTSIGSRNMLGPSVDRINPDEGYIPGNCQMVILSYNLAKNTGSHADVLRMAKALTRMSPSSGEFTGRFVDKFH